MKTATRQTQNVFARCRSLLLGFAAALALLVGAGSSWASWAGNLPEINKLADASMVFTTEPSITVDTCVKEVLSVRFAGETGDPSMATVLRLRGPDGEFLAYMGPARFLMNRGMTFEVGEYLAVEGVRAILHGEEVLVASGYATDDVVVVLRSLEGSLDAEALAMATWEAPVQSVSMR